MRISMIGKEEEERIRLLARGLKIFGVDEQDSLLIVQTVVGKPKKWEKLMEWMVNHPYATTDQISEKALQLINDSQRKLSMQEIKNTMKPYEKTFVHLLCAMKVSEDAICGIMAMLNGNTIAMDEVVAFIKENPQATESDIIKAASRAIHK